MNFDRLSSARALFVSCALVAGCGSSTASTANATNDDAGLVDETAIPSTPAPSDDASTEASTDASTDATAEASPTPAPDAGAPDGPTVSPDAPPASWFVGGTCMTSSDCAAGFTCEGASSQQWPGVCARKIPSCLPYPCAAGMNCYDRFLSPNVHEYSFCAPVPTLGEPCPFRACRDGYVCAGGNATMNTPPTCAQGASLGATCDAETSCAGGGTCEQTSFGATTSSCQPQVGLGAHCLNTWDCAGYDVWCDKTYRCAIRGGDGAPCMPSGNYANDPQCEAHYTCDPGTSTCTPIPPASL